MSARSTTSRSIAALLSSLAIGAGSSAAAEEGPVAVDVEQPQEAGTPTETEVPAELVTPPDVAAPPANAVRLPSGLAWRQLKAGSGQQRPAANDIVTVRYSGWTTDGELFDSSFLHGRPAVLPLAQTLPGLREAVQGMVAGEQRRLWIPEALAYQGAADAPAGTLVFDLELVSFRSMPAPLPVPATPTDVAAPPREAVREKSGLATKVVRKGTGKTRPTAAAQVEVHYAGWTTDGKLFDSSYPRGEPTRFPLDAVIAGWTEGVQLMVEGETRRLWIPEALAYRGLPGAPAGMLVFDVQLLRIVPAGETDPK